MNESCEVQCILKLHLSLWVGGCGGEKLHISLDYHVVAFLVYFSDFEIFSVFCLLHLCVDIELDSLTCPQTRNFVPLQLSPP